MYIMFIVKFLGYVNSVLFERVKASIKDKRLGGTTHISRYEEISKYCQMYYDEENKDMVNQLLNYFYNWFLFKVDTLPEEAVFTLDIVVIYQQLKS